MIVIFSNKELLSLVNSKSKERSTQKVQSLGNSKSKGNFELSSSTLQLVAKYYINASGLFVLQAVL